MLNSLRVLGLITARGGSKGLPGKNIRPLGGKPLIAWTIDAAKAAQMIDAVVVSTDDAEIAEVARQHGAEIPFLRPAELASDTAASIDVVLHAVDALAAAGRMFDIVVLLEPTSPLRDAADIDAGITRLIETGAGSVVGVCRAEGMHPAFMFRRGADERLKPLLDRPPNALRRQDLDAAFFAEGTLYASSVSVLREKRGFYHDDTVGYEVPKWKSFEIDDIDDLIIVEALAKHKGLVR